MDHRLLIVDDEQVLRNELAEFFVSQGLPCATASSGEEALELAAAEDFAIVLADVCMGGIDGLELVRRLSTTSPDSLVLIMTAHPTLDTAISALRVGAADYISKPLDLQDLLHKVKHLLEFRDQKMELRWYRQQLPQGNGFSNMVGRSKAIEDVRHLVQRVAACDSPVLITGESGTGKELVARAIHYNGLRKEGRFLSINCAAMPGTLMDGQLFGHTRGAYTGAHQHGEGLFLAANGGTLVLDEIAEIPLELQAKLLRAVENQEILALGKTHPVSIDVRIIACTNRNLRELALRGQFREDLYYRLSVLTVELPPLRDRREDIALLVEHFINTLNVKLRKQITGVTNEAMRQLLRYDWKGNIRELRNVIERAMILEDSPRITPDSLPATLADMTSPNELTTPLKDAVRRFECEYIRRFLQSTRGDKQLAAKLLGVSVSSIYRRLQEFGHSPDTIENQQESRELRRQNAAK